MRLTTFSDYALRVLMYATAEAPRLITIDETAAIYDISRGHLMKVVNLLTKAGYLRGVRGRSGGFTLAKQPEDINLGSVIRVTEPDFALVECFSSDNECVLSNCCRLPGLLNDALDAFVAVFDKHTLADIDVGPARFAVSNTIKLKRRGPTGLHNGR